MKKPERYFYPAIFTYESGQKISVDFPDLKCATSGTDADDALLSALELLGCVRFPNFAHSQMNGLSWLTSICPLSA